MRARSTSSAAQSRVAGSSPTSGTLRGRRAGSTGAVVVVVDIGVILPGPQHSVAVPQITPVTQLLGQSRAAPQEDYEVGKCLPISPAIGSFGL